VVDLCRSRLLSLTLATIRELLERETASFAAAASMSTTPRLDWTGFSADLRHCVRRGIPGLLYGPGHGFNQPRPNEHYFVDDLQTMVLST
jgi:hypothetical protein